MHKSRVKTALSATGLVMAGALWAGTAAASPVGITYDLTFAALDDDTLVEDHFGPQVFGGDAAPFLHDSMLDGLDLWVTETSEEDVNIPGQEHFEFTLIGEGDDVDTATGSIIDGHTTGVIEFDNGNLADTPPADGSIGDLWFNNPAGFTVIVFEIDGLFWENMPGVGAFIVPGSIEFEITFDNFPDLDEVFQLTPVAPDPSCPPTSPFSGTDRVCVLGGGTSQSDPLSLFFDLDPANFNKPVSAEDPGITTNATDFHVRFTVQHNVQVRVPEPLTAGLMGLGLIGLAVLRRRVAA